MITSTVAPLWLPLRASRSFDSLCFLPSAKDNPAASRVISTKSAIRLPQVVVVFRTLSLEGRLVAYISWAPKTALRGQEGDKARCLAFFQCWKYQVWTKNESIVQGVPGLSTKVQPVCADKESSRGSRPWALSEVLMRMPGNKLSGPEMCQQVRHRSLDSRWRCSRAQRGRCASGNRGRRNTSPARPARSRPNWSHAPQRWPDRPRPHPPGSRERSIHSRRARFA